MRRCGKGLAGKAIRRLVVTVFLPLFILAGTMGAGCDTQAFIAGSSEGVAEGLVTIFGGVVGASDSEEAFPTGATTIFSGLLSGFLTGFFSDDIAEFEETGSQT